MRTFVEYRANKWCPTWIRHNYETHNAKHEEDEEVSPTTPVRYAFGSENTDVTQVVACDTDVPVKAVSVQVATADVLESGEPPLVQDDDRPEEYTSNHHWEAKHRPPWQIHSEWGPKIDAEGRAVPKARPLQ